MVSILPSERTPFDVIMKQVGAGLQENLPQAVQRMGERERGADALARAESEIAQAGGDPYKIALAFARAGAQNPNLERSLGPLMQTAMQNSRTARAFGDKSQTPNLQMGQPSAQPQDQGLNIPSGQQLEEVTPSQPQSTFLQPSPFNILTPDQINAESERYAVAINDPNGYQQRFAQLQAKNAEATNQRNDLEDFALKAGVKAEQLPRFMNTSGSKFDTRNPTKWAENAIRDYKRILSNDEKLQRAFIPGLGSGLLGRDRDKKLKELVPTVQDQVKAGLEQETREFLADNYLSPTEVEEMINPLTPQKAKAVEKLPKGLFPRETLGEATEKAFTGKFEEPTISYEEAVEKAPRQLQQMQNVLSDFFLKNIDDKTSLLVLRDKLWNDKDYDWRQIGPAIREAEQKGLKLNDRQSTEMVDIETQPPIQSLPDIFQSLDRMTQYLRGNK